MLQPHDHFLPPDHDAFVKDEAARGRVIIIAPTRAACETIEIALGLNLETYLEKTCGEALRVLARSGKGFGIVAGTGTGKTLAVRPIAEEILRAPLRVGVVNREREATPELSQQNVVIVTTGIARRWFQDGDIRARDTLVVDEIHQTSAELELCLALGKRAGCRFVWLSATVDPTFYRRYLDSAEVLEVSSFDPKKAAKVEVIRASPRDFLNGKFLSQIAREKRGAGVFLPTRAGVEQAAEDASTRAPQLHVAYYHGGEPVRVIRAFLDEGGAPKPYLLAMTAAGQSALNVQGLDTVIIDDARFSNVIERGKNVLTKTPLGNNEILQMAGRVHGRVEGGRVFILSDRDIQFSRLRPTSPDFQLAGDSERVALTCADLGVRADQLELPVPLNGAAYRRAYSELRKRGIIEENGRLSVYGKAVETLPVERAWAELVVNAETDLLPFLAVMSSIESLHRMTRDERDIDDLIVPGSDHLTAYNLYAEAFTEAGFLGEVYGLPRQLFDAEKFARWCERRGVLPKAIEDAALAMACVFRSLDVPLPREMPLANDKTKRRFTDLLAEIMPFDLVIDERTADGQEAFVSRGSVCGKWGAIAGELRYFADRNGHARAAIEGTQIPAETLRRFAKRSADEIRYVPQNPQAPLVSGWKLEYHGFTLESKSEAIHDFSSPEILPQARRVLAEAMANFSARHGAVHNNRVVVEEVRDLYRRSGGQSKRLEFEELAAFYEAQLEEQKVESMQDFREARFPLRVYDFVPLKWRAKLRALPASVEIDGRAIPIEYEIETRDAADSEEPDADALNADASTRDGENAPQYFGVALLRLHEKLARVLHEYQLPHLDRPLRFEVSRGVRGAVRASSLEELQEKLEGPWTPDIRGENARDSDESSHEEKPPRRAPKAAASTRAGAARAAKKNFGRPYRGAKKGRRR